MPAPTYQAIYSNSARNASVSVSVTGAAVGDTLIAFQACDYMTSTANMVAPSSATGISSWTAVGNAFKGGEVTVRAWRATVTVAGTRTVTMSRTSSSSSFNAVQVVRVSGVDPNQPIDGVTVNGASSGSSYSLPSITAETPDALLLGFWAGLTFSGSLTISQPSSMSLMARQSPRDGAQASVITGAQYLGSAGATGTRVATGTTSVNAGWAGILVGISGVRFIPVNPGGDSGVGSDESTVDYTRVIAHGEQAAASDPLRVDRDTEPYADTATGADSLFVDILEPRATSDSGTGSDSVVAAVFKGNDLTDPATAQDPVDVTRLRFVTTTDQGLGVDESTLRQDKTPTDSARGSDSTASLRLPGIEDYGVGTDEVYVVDIPYTQVLKRTGAPPVVYDLVCMARIPQAQGAPAFVEIDPIEWKSLSFTNELSTAQTLSATCQISSVPETVLQRFRSPDELATEMWLLRNGVVVFAGPLVGLQTSGETLTINAAGLLAYLKLMIVTKDLRWRSTDQSMIVKALVDQWQTLPYGHFGIDTSGVNPSGQRLDLELVRDELINVSSKIDEMGKAANGFDVAVNPASRKLEVWHPGQGIDKSTGEDAIVFDGRNVTSSDIVISVAVGDLASEAFGTATASGEDKTWYSTRSNTELRARYGRSAVTSTFSDLTGQSQLDAQVQGLLDARKAALMLPGPKVRVTPDADLPDYGIGDTVAYDFGSVLGVDGAFRIRKQTVSATSTGQEAVDIEFV